MLDCSNKTIETSAVGLTEQEAVPAHKNPVAIEVLIPTCDREGRPSRLAGYDLAARTSLSQTFLTAGGSAKMSKQAVPDQPGRRQPVGISSGLAQSHPQYHLDADDLMAASVHDAANMPSQDSHSGDFENLDDFRLSYSFLDASMPGGSGTSPFFLDMYSQQSHDDSCLDNCQTIAVFNGSRLPHRGGSSSVISRQLSFPPQQFTNFDGPQTPQVPPFHQHQRTASESFQKSLVGAAAHLPGVHGAFNEAVMDREDEKSAGSSCCDSDCDMPDKCTDVSCENTTNACNDHNCPERAAPPGADYDVTTGAAALISINHAQDFQVQPSESLRSYTSAYDSSRRQSLAGLGLNDTLMIGGSGHHHDSFHQEMGSFHELVNIRDITAHVFNEHSDHGQSGCSGPSCLVDSMPDFSVCHLPNLDDYRFFNQYAANTYFPGGYTECGISVPTPEAFLHHFNEYHRHQLVDPSNFSHPGPSNTQLMTATGAISSPLANTHSLPPSHVEHFSPLATISHDFGGLDFKPHEPHQVAALGTNTGSTTTTPESPATLPKTPPSENPETPGTDVTMGPEWEHKCQWRDSGSLCGLVFDNTNDLFEHVNAIHVKSMAKGDGGYACQWDGCTRVAEGKGGFPQRSKIERHMQTHVGYKPHTCKQCGAGFSAKQALDQHLLIHTDQKPLQCPTCGKKIRHQSALTMHMRTHTGEKPLKCNICGKRFSESSNLSKHKRTHDEKGRFSCGHPGCDANFHRQDQLRRHRNNCHREDATGSPSGPSSPVDSQPEQTGSGSNDYGAGLSRPLHGNSGPTPSFDPQPIRKVGAKGVGKHGR